MIFSAFSKKAAKSLTYGLAAFFFTYSHVAQAINIQPTKAAIAELTEQLYQRECLGQERYLTHWNEGEAFASFGIGHFIWFHAPSHYEEYPVFEETFPLMFEFVSAEVAPPRWLLAAKQRGQLELPWKNKQAFDQAFNSNEMKSLRDWLATSKKHQATFVWQRFSALLGVALNSQKQSVTLRNKVLKLLKEDRAIFALIDYGHFKGMGTNKNERYQGQGWGLMQVLKQMQAPYQLPEFKAAAKSVLTQRVESAPKEKNETRWLQGWLNRIEQY